MNKQVKLFRKYPVISLKKPKKVELLSIHLMLVIQLSVTVGLLLLTSLTRVRGGVHLGQETSLLQGYHRNIDNHSLWTVGGSQNL